MGATHMESQGSIDDLGPDSPTYFTGLLEKGESTCIRLEEEWDKNMFFKIKLFVPGYSKFCTFSVPVHCAN